jgi:hypothetical protein
LVINKKEGKSVSCYASREEEQFSQAVELKNWKQSDPSEALIKIIAESV